MRFFSLLFVLLITLFTGGCAQKNAHEALNPPEIKGAVYTRSIAIMPFSKDYIGLAHKIEVSLTDQRLNNIPYFQVIKIIDVNKIMHKHNIYNGALIEASTALAIGKRLGAQAIISGEIEEPAIHDEPYFVTHTKCKGEGKKRLCWKVKVSCMKRTISLSTQIRMLNVTTGAIFYNEKLHRQKTWRHCADDTKMMPSQVAGGQDLASSIASNFVDKLTPHTTQIKKDKTRP